MSAISEKVRVALYGKLNVSGVTTLASVHESMAPEGTALPYLIFQRQASEPVSYSLSTTAAPTLQLESDLWLIKAVTDEDSDTTKEPQALAEQILTAAGTAIGNSLTLSGNTAVWVARFTDIPGYQEMLGDRIIYHRGFLLRVSVR